MPRRMFIVDYKRSGRGDAVLMIKKNVIVVTSRTSGKGYGAWARIRTSKGIVGFISVHAPRKRRKRVVVWSLVKNMIGDGMWVVLGDFNMVERTCSPKTSLIAWERVTQNRKDGGLGWCKFKEKAGALQLEGGTEDGGVDTRERCVAKSPLTYSMYNAYVWGSVSQARTRNKAVGILRKAGITSTGGGIAEGLWIRRLHTEGYFPEEEILMDIRRIEDWVKDHAVGPGMLSESEGWQWKTGVEEFRWRNETKTWIKKMRKGKTFDADLDRRWGLQRVEGVWAERWKRLWEANVLYRKKIWAWKILQRGMFTSSRAAETGVHAGRCGLCPSALETIDHVLWQCGHSERRRQGLRRIGVIQGNCDSLMEWIDQALRLGKRDPSYLNITIRFWRRYGRSETAASSEAPQTRLSIRQLLENTLLEIENFPTPRSGEHT
ncbi:hypothetical protein R1sor_021926 [Riccia sorocarpa]|uniref:Reverse transcriptase zinc-binding domain-containing protein n=1 Tax=Riccia sorocarpa TaxID=122646 RepID=A0ABD3GLQ3_9MARC